MCIVFIIAVALVCPVKIFAYTDKNKKLKLLYKWLFFTFGKKPNPNSPIIKFVKKTTGLSRFENFDNIGENIKKQGFTSTIESFFSTVSGLFRRVKYLLPHCRIQKFSLTIINATDDSALTAITYGAICGIVYPVLNYLFAVTKQKSGCDDINISCNFDSSESEFSFNIKFSLTAFFVLIAYLKLAAEHYKKCKISCDKS